MNDKLAQFANQNYLNMESYRKNGEAIRTPLWFVEDGDVLYFYTVAHSFKVKRLKNNPRVRIAPCDMRGNLKGDWLDASARLLDTAEASHANNLLNQKYGLSKRILNFFAKLRGHKRAAFAITLD
ncbi:MAG: PPOX class F420-dependent oxidoreductase [Acidobacteriota bacterium]